MRELALEGDPQTMGRQHGEQVRDLRPLILERLQRRLAPLEPYADALEPHVREAIAVWEEHAPSALAMLRGIAEALDVEWEDLFRHTIISYLEAQALGQASAGGDGCTVWAAAAPITKHGMPLLVKNRDGDPGEQPLQCLVRARPARGYRYAYLTGAGSPGVLSSGMNEAGLAVADTHVASLDVGPGIARCAAMMAVLEQHNSVRAALDYLRQVPHIGDGTLVLIDVTGGMAVFEAGHSVQGVIWPERGFVVGTNHFVSGALRERWAHRNLAGRRSDSPQRYARVAAALQSVRGLVDAAWAQGFMADHGGAGGGLCRHGETDSGVATLSSAIHLPQERTLLVADGPPCRVRFKAWMVG